MVDILGIVAGSQRTKVPNILYHIVRQRQHSIEQQVLLTLIALSTFDTDILVKSDPLASQFIWVTGRKETHVVW